MHPSSPSAALSTLAFLLALPPLAAQGPRNVTVPPDADVAERRAWSLDSHTNRARTLQHVISAATISAGAGTTGPMQIQALRLRAMPGGKAARITLDVRLGYAARTPRTVSDTLPDNRSGGLTTTRSGAVDIPASTKTETVTLQFSRSFPYDPTKGDLLVEVAETSRVAAAASLELATMATPARITRRGKGGPMSSTVLPWFPPIDLGGTTIVSGATPVNFRDAYLFPVVGTKQLQLTLRAPGKSTVFGFGLTDNTAIPLDGLGLERNHLYVKPLAVLPATGQTTIPYLHPGCPASHSVLSFRFQPDNTLNGLAVTTQGFTTDFPRAAFTDAMDTRFGAQDKDYLRGDHVRVVEALTGSKRGWFPTAWFGGLTMELVIQL